MDKNKYYKMTNPQYVNEINSVYDQMYNDTPREVIEEHGSKHSSPAPLDNRPSWARMLGKELRKKKEGPTHDSTKTKDILGPKGDRIVAADEGEEGYNQKHKDLLIKIEDVTKEMYDEGMTLDEVSDIFSDHFSRKD